MCLNVHCSMIVCSLTHVIWISIPHWFLKPDLHKLLLNYVFILGFEFHNTLACYFWFLQSLFTSGGAWVVYKRNGFRNSPFVLIAAKSGLLSRFQFSLFHNAHCNVIVFTLNPSLEIQSPDKSHSSKCKIYNLKFIGKFDFEPERG